MVAKDWARCYAFNIGKVKKGSFFRYFQTFPVNTTTLEARITKMQLDEITPSRILSFGVNTKGIYGIEYLLYKDDLQKTATEFKADEKRKKILQLIVNEFVKDVSDFHKAWEQFAPILIAEKEGRESANNSLNLIFGGIDNVINYAWETKVGKAIRKDDIEARYSKKSLDLIKENIAITKKVYFEGSFAQEMKATLKSDEWNDKIKARYQKMETILAEIKSPLIEAVKNEDKAKLEQLIAELKGLNKSEFSKVKMVLNLVGSAKEGDGD